MKPAYFLPIIFGVIVTVQCGKPAKRSYAVTDVHEVSSRIGFTGEHRLIGERRLADGTVEGESLFIRPDGRPVKVHYFGDGRGHRPKVEVVHNEHHITRAHRVPVPTVVETRRVVVPEVRRVVDVISEPAYVAPPRAVIAPPRAVVVSPSRIDSSGVNIVDGRTGQGVHVGSNGGDVAAAVPSVTAVIGPGAHAVISPEAEAHSAHGASFRSVGSGGDVSVANPQVTAIAGAGSSVVISPKARASSGHGGPVIQEVHHRHQLPLPSPVVAPVAVQRVVPVPVAHNVVAVAPKVIVPAVPSVTAVQTSGVLVVPPKSSYSYTYSYSAPDGKHPQRDNSAFVNVQVNQ